MARVPAWQAHRLLPGEDTKVMATLPVAWGAALYAVRERAYLRAGETVLVHSGAGAFGSAVIRLAQQIGAEVYTTVGARKRREFLIKEMGIPEDHIFCSRDESFEEDIKKATDGRGVDVVINSLVGDLMHASWRCVGDFGRFVEVGKKELLDAGKLDMSVFARGATFTAFDNTEMLFHPDDYYRKTYISMVKEILSMYRSGKIKPVPIMEFDVSEISQAYRFFSSKDRVGKVVISLENLNSIIKVMPPKYTSQFASHKSYLLVGALGGLGRSLSSWMRSQGARNFVFIARSGASKKEAKEQVDYLRRSGARVQVVQGDVSRSSDVEKAVAESKALGPIGGVVHAAMGLHEDLFGRMTNEGWHTSVRSKWRGAWNLHNALQSQAASPDFFLLASSMTGTVGVATETNYCAANAFLDAFSYWRRRQGLPTVSIGLGMVSEVGYLHENPQIEALLLRRGIQPLNEDEFLQVVDLGISNSGRDIGNSTVTNSHMLTGMETFGVRKLLDKGFEVTHTVMDDERSSILSAALDFDRTRNTGDPNNISSGASLGWMKGLPEVAAKSLMKETSAPSLKEALSLVIGRKFSNLILMPFEKIDYARSFAQLGVDSMIASEFRAWFWNGFAVDIPFLDFLSPDKNLEAVVSFAEATLATESKGKLGG
ncbi:unnamed protein product [Clonostachys rosea f. rosea IK726]|uniref:Uncharacterized protein n=1 Tax=Clonostachys rosea f. rosea IK726 TaxID=1349383 RepID=A0ACA9TPX7_BIOOC|nr:unnamed protein product [Clonostachys rosea f. rosea IK726]